MRAPIASKVTPHGAYLFDRGGGVTHFGIDLAGPRGTQVVAPEGGSIIETATATRKPWTGYAPVVYMRGDSGWYHLMAHTWPGVAPGDRVEEGMVIGQTGSENHTHWEMRRGRYGTGRSNTVNPFLWLAGELPMALPSSVGGDELWLAVLILLIGWPKSRR